MVKLKTPNCVNGNSANISQNNDGVLLTRNLILRSICAVYLCAFLSFFYQSQGLFGENGILPAYIQFGSNSKGTISAIHKNPTLLHLSSYIGLDIDYMMDFLALLGIIISFTGFVSEAFCLLPTFAALWSLYYSLVQITQQFKNEADLLLLEAGFLCLILAPINSTKWSRVSDKVGIVMLKWLLLRYLFDCSIAKFFSSCPHWRSFSALTRHFETLPIPTSLSWYCHHLPSRFLKVVNIYTNLSELICPWFFFFPSRPIRILLFFWELYLQLSIILTGNFGFLNYLIIVLLISLLDDIYIKKRSILRIIFEILISGIFFTVALFTITLVFSHNLDKIIFKSEYLSILRSMIKLSPLVALVAIIGTFLTNLILHPAIIFGKGYMRKILDINTLLAFTLASLTLVGLSVVPHSNVDVVVNVTNTQLGKYYQAISKYHIVNEYGRQLSKMRSERFEITLEYTQDVNNSPWNEIPFIYKPWNITEIPPVASPYLPRLDMKFYDASPANYRNHLWLLSLAYRILQNEPNVLKLLGIDENLNPQPKYVRGITNKFRYTTLNEIHEEKYWVRKVLGEHFPAFSFDSPTFTAHLKTIKIVGTTKKSKITNEILKNILDFIRKQLLKIEAHVLIISILITGLVIILLKK